MTSDFLKALDDEIADLERQLQAVPTFVKLSRLRSVRSLYAQPDAAAQVSMSQFVQPTVARRDKRSSQKKDELLRSAAERLTGRTSPTPTATLHASMTEAGIEVPGAKPRNYLSALLSHDRRFKSHGRAGWTLVQDVVSTNSNGADHKTAPSPSFESGSDQEAYRPGHDLLNQTAD